MKYYFINQYILYLNEILVYTIVHAYFTVLQIDEIELNYRS